MQVILTEGTSAPTFHLLKIVLTAYIPHKDQAFNGLDIGTSGNHIHCYSNARIVAIAELTEHALWIFRRVGDLSAKFVSLSNSSRTI